MTSYYLVKTECPYCRKAFRLIDVASYNTIDAKFYTDGFIYGPMYDEGMYLMTCPHCSALLWRDDLREIDCIDEDDYRRIRDKEELPLRFSLCDKQKYSEALHVFKNLSKNREKYLRIRTWWSYNDQYRQESENEYILTADQEANLKSLLKLLTEPGEALMKAEILRELGDYSQCIAIIDKEVSEIRSRSLALKTSESVKQNDHLFPGFEFIRNLAEKECRRVMLMNVGEKRY
jgi:hypothetical protein